MSVETYPDPARNRNAAETAASSPPGFRETIQMASRLAVETDDYLSFATVMDSYLGNPDGFTTEEATEVLTESSNTSSQYPIISYKVGWDSPESSSKYIERFSDNHQVESSPNQKPFLLVMASFSSLCEKGNPRELLVRACELMSSTERDENSRKMASSKLGAEDADNQQQASLEKMEQQGESASFQDIDYATQGFGGVDYSQQENVKFCTLFEVIRYSSQRIETPYPSSFSLEAAQTSSQVADNPDADSSSVTTYTRRMYSSARDFQMPKEEQVSSDEMIRVRNILVNFVTQTADVVSRKYSLKWSQRSYIQIRNKVALAPPTEREFVYTESEQTRRMSEVISRLAQSSSSYDFDPEVELWGVLGFKVHVDGHIDEFPSKSPTKVEGCEVLADNYWSRQLSEGPSAIGMAISKSQSHFDGTRHKPTNWMCTASHVICFAKMSPASAGFRDSASYWSSWVTSSADKATFANIDLKIVDEWSQTSSKYASLTHSPAERFVIGSIIARASRLVQFDFAYSFCSNVMKTSSVCAEQFVIVESSKVSLTGKVSSSRESADRLTVTHGTDDTPVSLTPAQIKELTKVSGDAIFRLKYETHTVAFYYSNFSAVVPTDADESSDICDGLDDMCTRALASAVSPQCSQKVTMSQKATAQSRQHALKNKVGIEGPQPGQPPSAS